MMPTAAVSVTLTAAGGLRLAAEGRPPSTIAQIRLLAKPAPSEPVMTQMTERTSATCNPIFDESFVLAVTEAKNSQLEITLWDVETPQPTNGFLGEVILNVGKLESLAGAEITQAFPLKTGKSIATSLEAKGTLQMTLKYEKPDTAGSQESASAEPETKAPMSRERFPVGLTFYIADDWDAVKPRRLEYEELLASEVLIVLDPPSPPPWQAGLDASTVEVVGCERWVGTDAGGVPGSSTRSLGLLAHLNLHSTGTASAKELEARLLAALEAGASLEVRVCSDHAAQRNVLILCFSQSRVALRWHCTSSQP